MSLLTKLFGQHGVVRFEYETYNNEVGTGKMNVEMFNVDNDEAAEEIKNIMFVETGVRVKELRITGFRET